MISDLIYYLLPVLLILIPAVLHLRSKKKTSEIHHAVLKTICALNRHILVDGKQCFYQKAT